MPSSATLGRCPQVPAPRPSKTGYDRSLAHVGDTAWGSHMDDEPTAMNADLFVVGHRSILQPTRMESWKYGPLRRIHLHNRAGGFLSR
jgi:hypothetical protein